MHPLCSVVARKNADMGNSQGKESRNIKGQNQHSSLDQTGGTIGLFRILIAYASYLLKVVIK